MNWHGGISVAHTDAELDAVVEVFAAACEELQRFKPEAVQDC